MMTAGTLSVGGLVGLQGIPRSHWRIGSARLGEFIYYSQTSSRPPDSREDGRGRVSCIPFPGTRDWQPAPPPLRGCVTVGRSRLLAAQSGPLAARRIAAPPWSIQAASGARFPSTQSAPGPAPSARGSHPTTTQDPLTTIANHHPSAPIPLCQRALSGPQLRKYLWLRRAGAEHWLRP